MNPFTLEGKTILITGASSGIGKATAILCSQLGATLLITGRNHERLADTLNALEGTGHDSLIADLTQEQDISRLIDWTPQIDGLVNNAGMLDLLPSEYVDRQKLDRLLSVNTYAPITLFAQLARKRRFSKGASVVFTSSLAGNFITAYGNSMYSVSKAAVSAFAKTAALEMAPRKIRVNCVCPGMIDTGLTNYLSPESRAEDVKRYPLRRYGRPEEVASGIAFLLSEAASFITGINLVIDGGMTLL